MGTRSLTRIWREKDKTCLVAIYLQFDGYLEGHGADLKDFLQDMKLCDGIGTAQEKGEWANGMECLSALIVSHFKKGVGGTYLTTPDNEQEWIYDIWEENGEFYVKVFAYDKVQYEGKIKEMIIK